jgi:hypothetical protein
MRQVHQRGVFVAEAVPASRMLLSAEKGAQGLMLGIILAPLRFINRSLYASRTEL